MSPGGVRALVPADAADDALTGPGERRAVHRAGGGGAARPGPHPRRSAHAPSRTGCRAAAASGWRIVRAGSRRRHRGAGGRVTTARRSPAYQLSVELPAGARRCRAQRPACSGSAAEHGRRMHVEPVRDGTWSAPARPGLRPGGPTARSAGRSGSCRGGPPDRGLHSGGSSANHWVSTLPVRVTAVDLPVRGEEVWCRRGRSPACRTGRRGRPPRA